MPQTQIKLIEKGEPITMPNLKEPYHNGRLETVAILEGGMVSGKTSVMLHIMTDKGESVIVETSAAIFDGLCGAVRGADLRFRAKQTKL